MAWKEYALIGTLTLGLPLASELSGFSESVANRQIITTRSMQDLSAKRERGQNRYEEHYQNNTKVYDFSARAGLDIGLGLLGFTIAGLNILERRTRIN